MLQQFSAWNYLLVFLALFSHYSYGKLLGIPYLLNRVLVGISFSGLVVGSLATFNPAYIKSYILFSVVIGYLILFFDWFKQIRMGSGFREWRRAATDKWNRQNIILYTFLLLIGLLLFEVNNPKTTFLSYENGNTYIDFNRHYSSYAQHSIEMLDADYSGFLKYRSCYPYRAYHHFFNSSTQAIAQVFIRHPGLFSYFMAQICLVILVVLSVLESFYHVFKLKPILYYQGILWLLIGFTVFGDVLKWNFITSSVFSVYAMVNILLLFIVADYSRVFLYILVLGASVSRFMPISLFMVVYLLVVHCRCQMRKAWALLLGEQHTRIYKLIFISMFLVYNVLLMKPSIDNVLFQPSSPVSIDFTQKPVIVSSKLIGPPPRELNFLLISYRFLGLISAQFDLFQDTFRNYNRYGHYFRKLLEHPYLLYVFLALFFVTITYGIYYFVMVAIPRIKKYRAIRIYTLFSVLFLFLDATLFILYLPYFFVNIILYAIIDGSNMSYKKNVMYFMEILWFTQLFSLLVQFTGVSSVIKNPILYITLDVALWGMIGVMLFKEKRYHIKYQVISFAIVGVLLVCFNWDCIQITRMIRPQKVMINININELVHPNFQRSFFVDQEGFFKWAFMNPDKDDDAYSSILGAKLPGIEGKTRSIAATYVFKRKGHM